MADATIITTIPVVADFAITGTRTKSWQLLLETVDRGIYGYGYGTNFVNAADIESPTPELDYFNIFGLVGNLTGYGIAETIGGSIFDYSYGWGYEFAPAVFSDGIDIVYIQATVKENDVLQSGVKVVFKASKNVTLSSNFAITDSNGIATISVSIDKSSTLDSYAMPDNGFFTIEAEIYDVPENENEFTIQLTGTSWFYDTAVQEYSIYSYAVHTADYAFS